MSKLHFIQPQMMTHLCAILQANAEGASGPTAARSLTCGQQSAHPDPGTGYPAASDPLQPADPRLRHSRRPGHHERPAGLLQRNAQGDGQELLHPVPARSGWGQRGWSDQLHRLQSQV